MQPLIPLESIHIAKPCRADWDKMRGDDRARHCALCQKNVYNLSAMTRAEAQRLILEKEGNLCVQLHKRRDGTVITSDCPVGIAQKRRVSRLVLMSATIVGAILSVFGLSQSEAAKKCVKVVKGSTLITGGKPSVLAGGISAPMIRGKVRVLPTPAPTLGAPAPLMGEAIRGDIALPAPTSKPKLTPKPKPRPTPPRKS